MGAEVLATEHNLHGARVLPLDNKLVTLNLNNRSHQDCKLLPVLLLCVCVSSQACEQEMVLSEHLNVESPSDYYLVEVRRSHGDNMVGTVAREFGGALAAGRTVSIQFVQSELADAVCALEFAVGETYLLKASVRGGALQVSRFNSHNVAASHDRFAVYVRDIESARGDTDRGE